MTSSAEFREFGKAMVDYVADYLDGIRDRPVLPQVKPGYLAPLVPGEAPEEPEDWKVRGESSNSYSYSNSNSSNSSNSSRNSFSNTF